MTWPRISLGALLRIQGIMHFENGETQPQHLRFWVLLLDMYHRYSQ